MSCVFIQTRSSPSFLLFLAPQLPRVHSIVMYRSAAETAVHAERAFDYIRVENVRSPTTEQH